MTAYGNSDSYCKVARWGATTITVLCFDGGTGNPVESPFDLVFSKKSPNNIPSFTYAWGNQPTAQSYHPNATYEHGEIGCSCPGNATQPNVTISHAGVGQYGITFPGMGLSTQYPSNVNVTGYGFGSDTCTFTDWFGSAYDGNGYLNINCFGADGTPVDAYFTVTYSSFAYIID